LASRVRGPVKRFGATVALDGVDLTAERGSVLGVLGPLLPRDISTLIPSGLPSLPGGLPLPTP